MPLTELDMSILAVIARYYVVTREQLQRLTGQESSSGRGMRKHLLRLRTAGLILMHRVQITLPGMNGAAPVYYATRKGAETLASYYEDDAFLATNTKHPRADRLSHWIAINDVRMLTEQAVERIPALQLVRWVTEWQTINPLDSKSVQFCLHTQISELPPLSCSPDAAFLLQYKQHRKVFYVEVDRGTSSPRQVAARKCKGYAALAAAKLHREKHFPETTLDSFRVLLFTTNAYRTQKTLEELRGKPGHELWLGIDLSNVQKETLISESIALDSAGTMGPLVHLDVGDRPRNIDETIETASPQFAASVASQ